MSDDRRQILELLSKGTISVEEAERLLKALGKETGPSRSTGFVLADKPARKLPKYLKMVAADNKNEGSFRMTVPLSLVKAGLKMKALVPENVREQTVEGLKKEGIDINPFELSPEELDSFIESLAELEMEAGGDDGTFKLYLE